MCALVQTAKMQLLTCQSTFRSNYLGKATRTKASFKSCINQYVKNKQYEKAFDSYNGFVSQYEHERSLLHLDECINILLKNADAIFSAKAYPPQYEYQLSILCYAQTKFRIPQLDNLLKSLSTLWGAQVIQSLKGSAKIPDSMTHLQARSQFTLEELHMFTHILEKEELLMKFDWFYENYPINKTNLPEQVSNIKVLGKVINIKSAEDPPTPPPKPGNEGSPLPNLPYIDSDSYKGLCLFVNKSLENWNTMKSTV